MLLSARWLLVGLVFVPFLVEAQPVRVNQTEYAALAGGLTQLTEDFSQLPPGNQAVPLVLRNGTYSGESTLNAPWCLSNPCLSPSGSGGAFTNFPANTRLWSLRVVPVANPDSNTYDAVVVGGSGTASFEVSGASSGFIAFHDPRGLTEVRLFRRNVLPFFGYSVDDMTTASGTPSAQAVPHHPLAMLLLGTLVLAIGGMAVRRA